MKLVIFNGSPRGQNSNTSVLGKWIAEGALRNTDVEYEEVLLVITKEHESYVKKLMEADIALITFPLYTDSMPGIVTAFIEKLQPFAGRLKGKKLGFEVHSGFPEAHHSRYVERYLIRLAEILDADYLGTVIMGESEAVRLMPESMQKKRRELYAGLGEAMIKEGSFDSHIVKKLARPEKLSGFAVLVYKMLDKIGLLSMYFKSQLKKNNVHTKNESFARPYVSESE